MLCYALVRVRDEKHLVMFRGKSKFGLKHLFCSAQSRMETVQYPVEKKKKKKHPESRIRLGVTTPGRNIAGSAVNFHLKKEQLCSDGGKCGPLQRPQMSQQFEHSTVTVLAALFGNNINDTQWSR